MAFTIALLNVRELRDKEVFNWLRTKTFAIYMLQEVHCTENTNHVWSAEWGYQTILSTFKSNEAEYAYFLTIICKFKNFPLTL